MRHDTHYIGKAEYCYANAAAMLLSSIDENCSPNRIEVLTGVGLGALLLADPRLLFFGPLSMAPDAGLSSALRLLGFEFLEHWANDGDAQRELLWAALQDSPVVLGPVDMGCLTYRPGGGRPSGVDHFLLAYGMDDSKVYIHDPWGYPYVFLTWEELKPAWRAERIGYKRGPYQFWTRPRRVNRPSEQEITQSAIETFKAIYGESDVLGTKRNIEVGADAIFTVARLGKAGKVSTAECDHLTHFALRLGAKRASDYADFFGQVDSKLGDLKRDQAELFGYIQVYLAQGDWGSAAPLMEQLAHVEEQFKQKLLSLT